MVISIKENGVILYPKTTQLHIPTVSQQTRTSPIRKTRLRTRRHIESVKKHIDTLYKYTSGLCHTKRTAFTIERLPRISSKNSSITAIRNMERTHFQSGCSYERFIFSPIFFNTLFIIRNYSTRKSLIQLINFYKILFDKSF